MFLRRFYVEHVRERPGANRLASRLYSTVFRGRRTVRGAGNDVVIEHSSWHRGLKIDVRGQRNVVRVASGVRSVGTIIRVLGDDNVVTIGEGAFLERGEVVLEDNGNVVKIGAKAVLCDGFHLAATEGTELSIGAECLFSKDVVVRTGDSHAIYDEGLRINQAADTEVGDRVWVGHGAKILKGSKVAPQSVVATGAIVTSAFHQEGSILAGVPADAVRTGITWTGERSLVTQA